MPTPLLLPLLLAELTQAHAGDAPVADPSWNRIVNGQVVQGDAWPAAVALGFDFGRGRRMQECSASLITPKLVLTAGHCTRELAAQFGVTDDQILPYMKVFLGDDINGDVEVHTLASVHVHPKYTSNAQTGAVDNDINVLELNEPVTTVEPVWFREKPVKTAQIGDVVTSVGYGITSSSRADQNSNGIKREADLVIDDVDSSFLYSDYTTNPGHTNICSGDSGGPQYAQVDGHLEQWGVHSFGFGSNANVDLCFQQSGSTNVGTYAAFVWKQVRAVHGDDYIPQFSDWDYCEARKLYLDRHCDPQCAQPDDDCAMDTNGDGEVSDEEAAAYDSNGDGTVTGDEFASGGKKGCDQSGGAPARLGALGLMALAVRRRRRTG